MKFTLTIEAETWDEFQQKLKVLPSFMFDGKLPDNIANVMAEQAAQKAREALVSFPADQGEEAPAEPKLTRKEKKARNRVKGNGAEPEAAAEAAEAPEAEQNVPQLNVLKKVITDAVLAEKRAAKTTKLRDMVETLKEDTGLDFVMSAKDEHRDALYAFTQKAGLTVA